MNGFGPMTWMIQAVAVFGVCFSAPAFAQGDQLLEHATEFVSIHASVPETHSLQPVMTGESQVSPSVTMAYTTHVAMNPDEQIPVYLLSFGGGAAVSVVEANEERFFTTLVQSMIQSMGATTFDGAQVLERDGLAGVSFTAHGSSEDQTFWVCGEAYRYADDVVLALATTLVPCEENPAVRVYLDSIAIVPSPTPSAEAEVRELIGAFYTATASRDGAECARLVTQSTLDTFDRFRTWALSASAAEIAVMPAGTRMMIATLRHRYGVERLIAYDAHALFAATVVDGLSGGGIDPTGVGEIQVEGYRAVGFPASPTEPVLSRLEFRLEQGAWKWDMTAFYPLIDNMLALVASRRGISEDAVIQEGLGVGPAIWEPPVLASELVPQH